MGLKQQNFVSQSSGGWKSTVEVLPNSFPGKNPFPGLQTATFSLCPQEDFPQCMHAEGDREEKRERGCSLMSLLIKTLIPSGQGPILVSSFNLYYFLGGLISKYSHTGGQGFNI